MPLVSSSVSKIIFSGFMSRCTTLGGAEGGEGVVTQWESGSGYGGGRRKMGVAVVTEGRGREEEARRKR